MVPREERVTGRRARRELAAPGLEGRGRSSEEACAWELATGLGLEGSSRRRWRMSEEEDEVKEER